MIRTAVFGGSFDPPHVGHLGIVSTVLNSGLADQFWIVPTGDIREKTLVVPAEDRARMVELLVEENFGKNAAVRLDRCQIDGSFPGSYTVDLMEHLQQKNPGHEFYFVIGTDLVQDLPQWKDAERLRAQVRFLVLPRPGIKAPQSSGFKLTYVPEAAIISSNASSTLARQLLKGKKKTAGILTPAVLRYITEHRLYGVS
jgi:nicotinate-nucleotide adenylyltransferase